MKDILLCFETDPFDVVNDKMPPRTAVECRKLKHLHSTMGEGTSVMHIHHELANNETNDVFIFVPQPPCNH